MDRKLKVAVIGTGNWGLNHAKVYARSNVADLACIVGRTESKAQVRAGLFHVPNFVWFMNIYLELLIING